MNEWKENENDRDISKENNAGHYDIMIEERFSNRDNECLQQ